MFYLIVLSSVTLVSYRVYLCSIRVASCCSFYASVGSYVLEYSQSYLRGRFDISFEKSFYNSSKESS